MQSLIEVVGGRFLDLYAGSGALGLEALSRGAAEAVLVESEESATAVMRANARALGLPARVVHQPVEAFVRQHPSPYDIVVLDPPYQLDVTGVLGALLPWLRPQGIVVCERASRTEPPIWPEGIAYVRSRRYGEATLHYGQRVQGER